VNCSDAPAAFRCPADLRPAGSDVAAVIPSFKRDYMGQLVAGLSAQTRPPARIFILQNAMHLLLNFTAIFGATDIPVTHVWFTNWNSLFFVTYVLMMFVPERFVLKIDDDDIPTNSASLASFVDAAVRADVIVGQGRSTLCRPLCGIKPQFARDAGVPDHVAFVVLYDTQAGKVLHRFRPFSLLGSEDIALSLTNAMECGTANVQLKFPVRRFQRDGNSHRNDQEIKEGYAKLKGNLFDMTYCYFIMAGYRPVIWRNFSIGTPTNIRWPID
jgi:hypothetical protein